MNSKGSSVFCLALIKLEHIFFERYSTFSEPKNDFKLCCSIWCKELITLTHIGWASPSSGFWQKQFEKIEPSELEFLSEIRTQLPYSELPVKFERLVYKTLYKIL